MKKGKKSYYVKLSIIGLMIIFLLISLFLGNNWIQVNNIVLSLNNLPSDFVDYKILQISDLHNKEFGKNNKTLVQKIQSINPDVIFITGDLIDYKKSNLNIALNFVSQINSIAPIYYVSGNHEWWSGKANELENKLKNINVISLDNTSIKLTKNDSELTLIGITDPAGFPNREDFFKTLTELREDNFTILLSHRAENFEHYVNNYNLVFSGHAHGGQVRIPFIGGLVSPNQGFFPEFTSGVYEKDETKMVVSRGLGNSIIPLRIFNRPELVVVEFK
jgi:uncharacterized protein